VEARGRLQFETGRAGCRMFHPNPNECIYLQLKANPRRAAAGKTFKCKAVAVPSKVSYKVSSVGSGLEEKERE
jgi:hypothetical protein